MKAITAPVLGDSDDELETEERKEAAKKMSQSSVARGDTEPPAVPSERPKKVHQALREDYRKTEALPWRSTSTQRGERKMEASWTEW